MAGTSDKVQRLGDTNAFQKKERNIIFHGADRASSQGFAQIPNFVMRNGKLSFGGKTVFGLIIGYAWQNDFCFPGQARLAEDCGTTQGRISQLTAELERHGLISIERRGQGKTNLYHIYFGVARSTGRRQNT
jgi:hypothetical protein